MSSAPRIVVVGSLNMDLVVHARVIPSPGQTVLGGAFLQVRGGKGGNQAVAAARLGAETAMIGRIGDDAFGESLCAGLIESGVNVDAVRATPGSASGVAMIVVDGEGQNAICVAPGANAALTPDDVRASRDLIARADVLLVQFETPLETVAEALRIARAAGVRTIVDPAPAPSSATHLPGGILRADVMTPNESEASVLTGFDVCDEASARAAGRALVALGAQAVAVKLGAKGAVWVAAEREFAAPAFRVAVEDTTAAGDAFAAGLAMALCRGDDAPSAVRFASAVAAVKCTKSGAQPGLPTVDEVRRFNLLRPTPDAENRGQGEDAPPRGDPE
ncbi:MAG: Ribokinase [Phycisphaerae bacterium]|nr:Ribokinase [Phycisphaerae bacterium]